MNNQKEQEEVERAAYAYCNPALGTTATLLHEAFIDGYTARLEAEPNNLTLLQAELDRLKSIPDDERHHANSPDFIGAEIHKVESAIELIKKFSPTPKADKGSGVDWDEVEKDFNDDSPNSFSDDKKIVQWFKSRLQQTTFPETNNQKVWREVDCKEGLPEEGKTVWVLMNTEHHYGDERGKQIESTPMSAYYTKDGWCYEYGELLKSPDEITHWLEPIEQTTAGFSEQDMIGFAEWIDREFILKDEANRWYYKGKSYTDNKKDLITLYIKSIRS